MWTLIVVDVKSASLQAAGLHEKGVWIFGVPTKDMRKRLARLMNLKPNQILRMQACVR